jgi:D-xylose transport system substrate-binding protein
MSKSAKRLFLSLGVLLVLVAVAAGCGGGGGGGGGKIALLLPESKTSRYEAHDRPEFEAKVEEICEDCEIIYSNANQNASQQQSQAEAALTQGATSASAMVQKAKQEEVPVISYDRLILGAPVDYYISFDNEKVGELQGETLSEKLKEEGSASGPIVMINGAPTDNNATLFKKGATRIFSKEGVNVAKSYDTPDWSPDKAQNEMEQAITALGKNGFAATYAANDGTAGGAIAAMKSAGIEPASKPTTGQDAELEAIQRILVGEQFMTVYKAIEPEANAAAEMAVALAEGEEVPSGLVNGKVNNELEDVPSVLLEPVAVTKENINNTIVTDEFWTASEICTSAYKKACEEAGIE